MSVHGSTVKKATLDERRKRVERLKKTICIIVIVCLLLPIILCLTLWGKVVKMEKKIDSLVEMHTEEYQTDNITDDKTYAVDVADVDKSDEEQKGSKDETNASTNEESETKEVDQTKIKGKKVYLTFDDGPSENTAKVLEVLKKNNIKATFFVIGRTDKRSKELYKQIYKEGHTLAMHSYTHDYQTIYKSVDAYKKDITKLSDLLYEITGERSKYIRFPGGSSNAVSKVDMKKVILYTKDAGFKYYDWNVINGDATGKKMSESEMVSSVVSGVKQYDTSIVLMHDCAGKEMTVKTLPSVIKKLKKMKVTFLPIDDTTTPIQHIKAEDVK